MNEKGSGMNTSASHVQNANENLVDGVEWEFESLDHCINCGGSHLGNIHKSKPCGVPLQFDQCADCLFIFQNPRLTRKSLDEYFNSSIFIQDSNTNDNPIDEQLGYFDYFAWDRSYKKTAEIRLRNISRLKPPPGRLLEIGTATGSFLNSAQMFGYQVRGLDISNTFAEGARKRYGLDIDIGWIEEFPLPEATYDVVCMWGGISCWRDLNKGLENVYQTLNANGVFCFTYQDYYGPLGKLMKAGYPEFNHASLSIMHRRSMYDCLEKAGFKVEIDKTERQIASLERIVTYLKLGSARKLVNALKLDNIEIPVLAVGTKFVIASKK